MRDHLLFKRSSTHARQVSELLLNLPWVQSFQEVGDLTLRRDRVSVLRYDDGIELAVQIVDPADFDESVDLIAHAERERQPGRVVLVAGVVPLSWRSKLRRAGVSFVDPSGVAEIAWPRVNVSSGQFARSVQRSRSPLPMQKSHAVAVQELTVAALRGERLSVGEVAERSNVGLSSASRAISQLEAHGLVEKHRGGRAVLVDVADPVLLAERLAERTAWPHGSTLSAFAWGRHIWEVAAAVTQRAQAADVALSVTGRTALAYFGVLGTSPPRQVRCWVGVQESQLAETARRLGLEPAPLEESNVVLAADPWGVGMAGCAERTFEGSRAVIAQPVRVWCDLHSEQRGTEFAAQLWKEIESHG